MPYDGDGEENQQYLHNFVLNTTLALAKGVDPERIGRVNEYLYRNNKRMTDDGTFLNAAKFGAFVKVLYEELGIGEQGIELEDFKGVFGLRADSVEFEDDTIALAIRKQCINNLEIYKQLDCSTTPKQKEIYGQFLALEKSQPLSQPIAPYDINNNLASSKTAAEFMSKYGSTFGTGRLESFFEAKQEFLRLRDPYETLPVIKKMKNQYEQLHEGNESFKKTIKNTDSLISLNPRYLERPVSTSKGREHAQQLRRDFEGLARDCDLYLEHLKKSQNELSNILASIPDLKPLKLEISPGDFRIIPDTAEVKSLKELRKNVEKELADVQANIEKFTEVKAKIQGDDPNDPGFLLAIDTSLQKLDYEHQSKGVNRTIVDEADVENAPVDCSRIDVDKPFSSVTKLEPGKCKVVSLVHGSIDAASGEPFQGQLVEKQGAEQVTVNNKGETKTVVPTTFDLRKFPTGDGSKEAKIFVAMNIAAEILANLNEAPDKKHPIQLSGERKEELAYIWTALMVLGQNNPHLKFGSDAIQVHSSSFKPENEKRFGGGFSKNSLYETTFKGNAQVQEKIDAHKALTDVKFGHEKEISHAGKDMGKIKKELEDAKNSVLEDMPDEEKEASVIMVNNPGS